MEVRVVQSAATTESIATASSDARPTCAQLAAITPPEAAALVPEEDFSDIEETRVGSSRLRVCCCHACPSLLPSPRPSPSLILSQPISPLRCSSQSLPLLVAPPCRLRFLLRHASFRAYLPLTTQPARTRLCLSAPTLRLVACPSVVPFPRAFIPTPGPFPRLSPFIIPSSYLSIVSCCHGETELLSYRAPLSHCSSQFWEDEGEDVEGRIVVEFLWEHIREEQVNLPQFCLHPGMPSQAAPTSPSLSPPLLPTTPSLYSRVAFVSRVEFLWEHIQEDQVDLPEVCLPPFLLPCSPTTTTPLPSSLYSRVAFVSRVEFLWEHIREDQVDLPEFCLVHDGKLEAHPLLDYGFQLDRVAAGQHLPVGL
ncbi:unnamed protein product [Closterium sp. NIES-54]